MFVFDFRSLSQKHPHQKTNLQLRVIRAFRSTLEDLEERRSVHSLRSLHPNMAYFNTGTQKNLTPFAAHQQYQQQQLLQRSGLQSTTAAAAMSSNLPDMSYIDEDNGGAVENGRSGGSAGQKSNYNDDLTKPVHETRI